MASVPEMRGRLGMSRDANLERGQKRLTGGRKRKLLQVKLGCFAQIGESLWHAFALAGSAGFGVQSDKTTLLSRNKDSGQQHGEQCGRLKTVVKERRGCLALNEDQPGLTAFGRVKATGRK